MAIKSAIPYLILNGRAKQAIEQYKSALNGEVTTLQRFGDVDQSCPAARKDLVMHAELKMGAVVLMLSDGPGEGPVPTEGAVQVALNLDEEAELRRAFDALAAGGKVIESPMNAPWGGVFGALIDRFGVGWMFTCPK
jgi:PhnB protein